MRGLGNIHLQDSRRDPPAPKVEPPGAQRLCPGPPTEGNLRSVGIDAEAASSTALEAVRGRCSCGGSPSCGGKVVGVAVGMGVGLMAAAGWLL